MTTTDTTVKAQWDPMDGVQDEETAFYRCFPFYEPLQAHVDSAHADHVLEEAPVFSPTPQQWKDSLHYVETVVRPVAERVGMARVRAPRAAWGSVGHFAPLPVSKYCFRTKKQPIHRLQHRQGPNQRFLDTLDAFRAALGHDDAKDTPCFRGQEVDLCTLFMTVRDLGGYDCVCSNDLWDSVARHMKWHRGAKFAAKVYKSHLLEYANALALHRLVQTSEDSGNSEGKACEETDPDFGYGTGPEMTLEAFQRYAEAHHAAYWDGEGPPDRDVEREYWRVVENGVRKVDVLYGSDLSVLGETHPSGFPMPQRDEEAHDDGQPQQEEEEDVKKWSSWNLNLLPKQRQSLLRHMREAHPGVTDPMVYVGMLFSTFCWHKEDNFLYSINYLHTGAHKTWYGVPAHATHAFETAFQKQLPHLFATDPDLMHQLVTQVSPYALASAHNIPICHTVQEPGDFVITFPRAYHCGFNHGFNVAEAVNFALAHWISHGVDSLEEYRRLKRPSAFNHREFFFNAVQDELSPEYAEPLRREYARLVKVEEESRAAVKRSGISYCVMVKEGSPTPQCAHCYADLFFSSVCCSCDPSTHYCSDHMRESHCDCEQHMFICIRHSMSTLRSYLTPTATPRRPPRHLSPPKTVRKRPREHYDAQ